MRGPRTFSRSRRQLQFEPLEARRLLANVPSGFTETVLAASLTSPTTLDIEQSGRIWVAYQDGRIEVIEDGTPGTQLAYQLDADGSAEHGLQGIELDPDFENNHYIYVYYTANSPEPHNRLSRLTVDPTTENTILAGSEVPLLELPNLSEYGNPPWHIGGAIHFGLDGSLYVQIGESQQTIASQDLESPLGKIFRVDPANGNPLPDNPYYDAGNGITWRDYIWASGLRNPFAGDLNPITGQFLVADVGQGSWEEINDATLPGLNFGWPSEEGPTGDPNFIDPFYAYSHAEGCAITGGAFNVGGTNAFPSEYDGMFFFSEFCGGEIRVVDPNDPNPYNAGSVEVFATQAAFPMNIEFGPDGALYYISRGAGAGGAPGTGTGSVRRIEYAVQAPPSIVLHPNDLLVSGGYDASFAVEASGTPPLAYQWQVSTGGGYTNIANATSETLLLNQVPLAASGNQYRVIVTNQQGTAISDPATLTVTSDTPPMPFITLPSEGQTYRAGDLIAFSGGAEDLEDGSLSAADLIWRVDFHHNTHAHPFIGSTSGITGSQFTAPTVTETDHDVWFRINLTVTDSAGLSTSIFRDVYPEKSDFAVETNLPNQAGDLLVDTHSVSSPFAVTGVENVQRTFEVQPFQTIDGITYAFEQWLDGDTNVVRTVPTPLDDTRFVALYSTFGTGQATYLSDLTPVGAPVNGWGPIELDTSNGEDDGGDGNPITLNGVVYDKGLGVHAYSEITYNVSAGYSRFISDVGVDDEKNGGTVVFRVLADGNEVFNSGVMNNASQTQVVNVGLTGVDELTLIVENAGDGNGEDHADWADARLLESGASDALLPFAAADIDLNTRLNLDDAVAFAAGWGQDGAGLTLEQKVRQGDLNFDGNTDAEDWELFHTRWLYENNAPLSLADLLNRLPGDYNRNGLVSEADYQVWKQSFGTTSLAADGNGDGAVTAADYSIWRDNLGAESGTSVPLENLVLYINPNTGDGLLKNETASSIDLVGYTIESTGGALLSADTGWNSLSEQGLGGWFEVGLSSSALNEVNPLESLLLAPGESIHLGSLFDTAFANAGMSLDYGESTSTEAAAGLVVFSSDFGSIQAPGLGELSLLVDPATGNGGLRNDSNAAIDLVGYTVLSTNSSLLPNDNDWSSLEDQNQSGWEESTPTASALTELNAEGSLLLAPGQFVGLGHLFDASASKNGLVLEYAIAGSQESAVGVATFANLPPATASLALAAPMLQWPTILPQAEVREAAFASSYQSESSPHQSQLAFNLQAQLLNQSRVQAEQPPLSTEQHALAIDSALEQAFDLEDESATNSPTPSFGLEGAG